MSERPPLAPTVPGTPAAAGAGARIVDRGYQHYAGVRRGPAHGVLVMLRGGLRRIMGIRRPTRAKVLPWLLIAVAYVPVVVVLGIRLIFPAASRALPGYGYFLTSGIAPVLFVLFAGLLAPDLLCMDRRERVLSLIFAAPVTRLSYVAAQVVALTAAMLLLTLGPALLLYAGSVLLAPAALPYLRDHLEDLGHILAGGGLIALYYSAVALAVAAFTDRRAYASGIFLGLMLISGVVSSVLLRLAHAGAAAGATGRDWLGLLDLVYLPLRVVREIFGLPLFPQIDKGLAGGVTAGVLAVALALTAWRYLRLRD